MKKFSVWILPDKNVDSVLSKEIERLSTLTDFRPFQAHLTILGGVPSEEKIMRKHCEELVKKVSSFSLQSAEVAFSTTFFQNVFIRIQPNAALTDCFLNASEIFEFAKGNVYMPHISLTYGNQSMQEREEVMNKVTLPKFEFAVNSFFLFDCDDTDYTKWSMVEEYPLR